MWSFFIGVISGVVASAIGLVVRTAIDYWRNYRRSPITGEWDEEIYASDKYDSYGDNRPVKKDCFNIRHNKRTNQISGSISRVYPPEQKHREWQFIGVVNKDHFIASFWSRDLTQRSNGAIYAKLVPSDNAYRGYYLEEHNDGIIDKTPIIIYKKGTR